MRRLPTILLNTATAISLLLCVLAVGLWACSYHRCGELTVTRSDGREWSLGCDPGGCYIDSTSSSASFDADPPHYENGWTFRSLAPEPKWLGLRTRQFLGFGRGRSTLIATPGGAVGGEYRADSTVVRVPLYALLTVTALPVLARVATRRAVRREGMANRCTNCSYDLRATPDRCPECGTIPTKV